MSTGRQEGGQIAAPPLARRVTQGADAVQIGAAIFAIWEEIDDVLTPILGERGVVALYKRSLHLAAVTHPWLAAPDEGEPPAVGPAALKSALVQQTNSVAALGADTFLQTFHGLVVSLVGSSLTDRLLRSVWAGPVSEPTAKDTSP